MSRRLWSGPPRSGCFSDPANSDTSCAPARAGGHSDGRRRSRSHRAYAERGIPHDLTPHQRAALVLREAFELSIREIGDVLRLSEGSVRMLIQRARDKLRMHRPDRRHSMRALESNTRAVLHRLVEAMRRGNVAELAALLTEDVTLRADSDGQVTALPGPMTGAERVATLLVRVAARRLPGSRVDLIVVNALPALWISFARTERRQAPHVLLTCDLSDSGTIRDLFAIVNPLKLSRLSSVGISERAAAR